MRRANGKTDRGAGALPCATRAVEYACLPWTVRPEAASTAVKPLPGRALAGLLE
jgi:hypothetical protein